MIRFEREELRDFFHSLPIDEQIRWSDLALFYASEGRTLCITQIFLWGAGSSEVSFRIDKEFEANSTSVDLA